MHRSLNLVKVIKSRVLRWAGYVARMEESRNPFKIVTVTRTGKRLLGRFRRRWEDIIRMDFQEIVDSPYDRENWRTHKCGMNLRVP